LNEELGDEAKIRGHEEYPSKDKEVKRSVGQDKRDYVDKMAAEAEEAAESNDSRKLHQISKALGKSERSCGAVPVRDKEEKMLVVEDEQLQRWTEHFEEVLNKEEPQRNPVYRENVALPIETGTPTAREVLEAIERIKNSKLSGSDGKSAELFKVLPQNNTVILHKLFQKILDDEKVPEEWLKGLIAKIPKKGGKIQILTTAGGLHC
jgi:hypothetical protein